MKNIDKMTIDEKMELYNKLKSTIISTGRYKEDGGVYTDTDDFIEAVVGIKNYNAVFEWPIDIAEQFEAHWKIDKAVTDLGGDWIDKSKWDDVDAVECLERNDKFKTQKNVITEAMDLFFYNWSDVTCQSYFKNKNKAEVIKEVYKAAQRLVSTYVDATAKEQVIIPSCTDDLNYVPSMVTHCCSGFIQVDLTWYQDTGYEIGIQHTPHEGHSESWDWSCEDRKLFKPIFAESDAAEKEDVEVPEFDTEDFWKIFDKEIEEYAIAWRNEETFDAYLNTQKTCIIGSDYYPGKKHIIDAIVDIIAYNADIGADKKEKYDYKTKYVYLNVFKGDRITDDYYEIGDSWYFYLDGKQYMASVLRNDDDSNTPMLTVVCLDHNFRCYITDGRCESF